MPLDIVIFGVIAVFLIFRFLGVLGQNDKDDGRPRRDSFGAYRKHVEAEKARRAELQATKTATKREQAKRAAAKISDVGVKEAKSGLPSNLNAKHETSPASSPDSMSDKAFLEGAKGAFAMILEAYADGDRARLTSLIAKGELLSSMVEEIAKREKSGHRLAISLHEIMESKITRRDSDASYEYITVEFVSKQCHLEFDKDNKLVDGDPDVEEVLTDSWTFHQPYSSDDPTWFLCATRSSKKARRASRSVSKGVSKKSSKNIASRKTG